MVRWSDGRYPLLTLPAHEETIKRPSASSTFLDLPINARALQSHFRVVCFGVIGARDNYGGHVAWRPIYLCGTFDVKPVIS